MSDVVYLVVTLVFFALMLAYVRACEALGSDDRSVEREP